jgi:hypothetical protein
VGSIFGSAGAREYPEQTTVMKNLSLLLRQLDDYAAALPLTEKVLELQSRALGPEASELAGTLGNLCDLRLKMDDDAQARRDCERSLALWEKDPGA